MHGRNPATSTALPLAHDSLDELAAERARPTLSMVVSVTAVLIFAISWRQHNIPCPADLGKTSCYAASAR